MGKVVFFALFAATASATEQIASSVASSMGSAFTALQGADAMLASMVTGSRTCPADCVTYFDGCGDCVCANGFIKTCESHENGCKHEPPHCKATLEQMAAEAVGLHAAASEAQHEATTEHGLLAQLSAQAAVAQDEEQFLEAQLFSAQAATHNTRTIEAMLQADVLTEQLQAQETAAQRFADAELKKASEQLDITQAADAKAASIARLAQHAADKALIAQVSGLRDISPDASPEAMLLANMAAADTTTTTPPITEELRGALGHVDGVRGGHVKECTGHITPETDISEFVGCTQLSGYLDISGTSMSSLDALRSVRRLTPTEDSPEIGIRIHNNPHLTDLSGLAALEGQLTGGIEITDNPSLVSLDGLDGLTGVGSDGGGHSVIIQNNSALQSTEALAGALHGELEGSVTVDRNPQLELLLGFEQVTGLGHDVQGNALVMQHNSMMKDINTWSNCTALDGALVIKANDRLRSLEGLHSLQSIARHNVMGDALLVFGNRALRDLEGLNSLHGVLNGAIGIEANPSLQNIDALASVEGVSAANVLGNAVEVAQNTALVSLGGLSGLQGQLGGALTIKDNAALPTLDGLQGVTGINGHTLADQALVLSGNTKLTDVGGLGNLGGAISGGVTITDSPLLASVAPIFEGERPVTQTQGKITIDGVQCISSDEQRFVAALCTDASKCDIGYTPTCAQLSTSADATAAVHIGTGTGSLCGGTAGEHGSNEGSEWQPWALHGSTGLYLDVNTTVCHFGPSVPVYVSSVEGDAGHWQLVGVNSIYEPSPHSFRLYTWHPRLRGAFLRYFAARYRWRISWLGGTGRHTGRTTVGASGWADVSRAPGTVTLNVDTSGCDYRSNDPVYIASLQGAYDHWRSTGVHNIYLGNNVGFHIYISHFDRNFTALDAERRQWSVQWIGSDDTAQSGHSNTNWRFFCATDDARGCKHGAATNRVRHALMLDVDTSESGFGSSTPAYVSAMAGMPVPGHFAVTGGAAIFRATPSSFRVYLDRAPTGFEARQAGWRVGYIGFRGGSHTASGGDPQASGAADDLMAQLFPTAQVQYETSLTLALRLETVDTLTSSKPKQMILRAAVGSALGVKYTSVALTDIEDPAEAHDRGVEVHFATGVVVTAVITTTSKALSNTMVKTSHTPAFGVAIEHTFEQLLNKYGYKTTASVPRQLELLGQTRGISITQSVNATDHGNKSGVPTSVHMRKCSHVRCKYLELYGKHTHRIAVVHNNNNATGIEKHGDSHHCKYDLGVRECICLCHFKPGSDAAKKDSVVPPHLALQLLR